MDKQNKYKPVKHTKATTARPLAGDPEFKKSYDELEDEFAALDALLSARAVGWIKPGRSSSPDENQGFVSCAHRSFSGKPGAFAFLFDASKIRSRIR